jgi:hypothetical protein
VTTERLIRWAGLATILGSVSLLLFPVLHPNHDTEGYRSWIWIPAHLTPHIAAIAFLFGLPAIYARQGERNGWLGLAGYVLATIANAQLLMIAWVELFMFPYLGLQGIDFDSAPPPAGVEIAGPLMNLSMAVGYFVLGLSIVRAGVLPRGAGVLLMVGAPFFALGDMVLRMLVPDTTLDLFFVSTSLFGLAMGWVGLALWTGQGERGARSAAAPGRVLATADRSAA